jgi:phosphohistidine phosphatase
LELILWRHAEAEDGTPDRARALTRKGEKQAERMAKWLSPRLEGEWRILVSPAKRTLQTVEPLGREFEVNEAVGTDSSEELLLHEAGWPDAEGNVMVVGHNPTFGAVAARLIGARHDVVFKKGAVWWFSTRNRLGQGEVLLRAAMSPDLAD